MRIAAIISSLLVAASALWWGANWLTYFQADQPPAGPTPIPLEDWRAEAERYIPAAYGMFTVAFGACVAALMVWRRRGRMASAVLLVLPAVCVLTVPALFPITALTAVLLPLVAAACAFNVRP